MEIVTTIGNAIKNHWLSFIGIFLAISIIAVGTVFGGVAVGFAVAAIPLLILFLMALLYNPYWGLITVFVINYFVIVFMRYANIEGFSVAMDILMGIIIIFMVINVIIGKVPETKRLSNGLVAASLLWTLFCVAQLFNPTGMVKAWFLSRGLVYYFPITVVLTILLFNKRRDVFVLLHMLSILTLIGVIKGLMQKYLGFDAADQAFLNSGGAKTHLLSTGVRYFSIYASAGIFGVMMGFSMLVFGISAIYAKRNYIRIYFIIIALLSLYGLLLSGTRGAIAVPVVGMVLFLVLSKNVRIAVPSAFMLIAAYVFLAHTTILQGNEYVRRMRTAFDPNEPSLVVRKENQKLFGEYLADKPFGEGLGLSGVEAQDISMRFTSSIPTDSWFVKIWVETGIVGLVLYILIFGYLIAHGSYILLFKVHDRRLKGVLSSLLCGVAGLFVSSYGNLVLGQFPVAIIVYMSLAFVFVAPYIQEPEFKKNKL